MQVLFQVSLYGLACSDCSEVSLMCLGQQVNCGACALFYCSSQSQLLPHSGRKVFSFYCVCRGVHCWISSDQISRAVALGLHWCVGRTGLAPKVGMKPLWHAAWTMSGFPQVSLLAPYFLTRGSFTSQAQGVLFALGQNGARYHANNSTA